jgi:hypothetical protein
LSLRNVTFVVATAKKSMAHIPKVKIKLFITFVQSKIS